MTIVIYIILGLIVAIIAAIVAVYVGGIIYVTRNPEKLLAMQKLREEFEAKKQNNTVCEVCITMRKPDEIAVITSHLSNPPKSLRYCNDNENCRQLAFTKLQDYLHDFLEARKVNNELAKS